jgi:hypothetical protein
MKREIVSWVRRGAASFASAAAGLLAVYLYVAPCSGGDTGFVFAFRAKGVQITGGFCHR